MNNIASSLYEVEKRSQRFFAPDSIRMKEVHQKIVNPLMEVGDIYVIGGAIRDLAFFGANSRPTSDFDFVIFGDPKRLDQIADKMGCEANRFGGYAYKSQSMKVDFWALSRTWAKVNRHVNIKKPEDLVTCTFFDWDAVTYNIAKKKVHARNDYIDRLRKRVIDINLLPNPSPHGQIVRGLRRLVMYDLRPGKRLRWYLKDGMRRYSWESIVSAEKGAYHISYLDQFESRSDFDRRFLIDNTLSISGIQDRRQLCFKF